ncbi:16S rRNA (uracil(1498)-N(3))-methyltransferase [Caldicellulosiruptor changbaiensis]|uniref:Ribosomal RNA small subunit methyltransferase E n=1 Tax=Caldicellulosiruptor changbaiensis TaxID=1222016 RepID=A0A3T0D5Z6_9FIRM|nr:RsmE family RNA methyltransferase [Caldicellulosiruptor changbaiensis]AZT90510.1 16S rRNA (uracil(1498)-N(3))-methyltransferase [Caldicellulosiruptor changbaiensis]
MPIFFIESKNIINDTAYITDKDDINHIVKVLRKREGEALNLCDGVFDYKAKILEVSKDRIKAVIEEKVLNQREPQKDVFLFQCIIKNQKMDIIIQKATELGVKTLVPVISKRVVIDISEKEEKKIQRWQKIAKESQKQCLRPYSPQIQRPIEIGRVKDFLDELDLLIIPYEKENKKTYLDIHSNINRVGILIGPEGGFEEEEIEIFKDLQKVRIVSLGKRILRSETAAISVISIVMHLLGEM